MATQDQYIRTALRVPPELHALLHEAASSANRTFNAEIIQRLESTFAASTAGPGGDLLSSLPSLKELDAQLGTMAKRVAKLNTQLAPGGASPATSGADKPAAKRQR